MILSKEDAGRLMPLNSEQCCVLGVKHRGLKKKHLVGLEVERSRFDQCLSLSGLRRNMGESMIVQRPATLRAIGFDSYSEYLASSLWAGIRQQVFRLRGRVCLKCYEANATSIHHEMYSEGVLLGKPSHVKKWLVPLCDSCHESRHFVDGQWVDRFVKMPINA